MLAISVMTVGDASAATDAAIEKIAAVEAKAVTPTGAQATPPAPEPTGVGKVGVDAAVKSGPAKPVVVAKPRPPTTSLKISVDLSTQRMSVKEHGKAIHSWPVSSGRAGFPTVTGHFRPLWLTPMHYSRKYDNAPMPNAIFFKGGFAIHATYATGLLGRPASHGCIRLSPSNARTLYGLVQKHGRQQTAIVVHGTAREPAPAVAAKATKPRLATAGEQATWSPHRNAQRPEPPKIIYRNGQAFIYVGREQAQRYWRQRHSGSFSSW